MKHYLIISSEFPPGPGGIGSHAYSMAKALVRNGITVTVVCNMDHATEEEITVFLRALPKGLNVYRIRRNGFSTYTDRVQTVLRLYRENRFNKVIVTGQFSIWLGGLLHSRYKARVTAFVHGSELYIGGFAKQQFTKYGLLRADKIFAVSNYTAKLTRQLVNKHVDVLPNGIDTTQWENASMPLQWKGNPKLLTVGSVTPRKGQHNVITALPALAQQYPDIHYHMVGLPAQQDSILALAQTLGVAQHITIHGKLGNDELRSAYTTADIFIMLSEQDSRGDIEGFGIAILEANASGKPAIGSKSSGIEDAIEDGVTGYLVDPKQTSEVVRAVERLMHTDKKELATKCMNRAQQYDWDKIAQALL